MQDAHAMNARGNNNKGNYGRFVIKRLDTYRQIRYTIVTKEAMIYGRSQ